MFRTPREWRIRAPASKGKLKRRSLRLLLFPLTGVKRKVRDLSLRARAVSTNVQVTPFILERWAFGTSGKFF